MERKLIKSSENVRKSSLKMHYRNISKEMAEQTALSKLVMD